MWTEEIYFAKLALRQTFLWIQLICVGVRAQEYSIHVNVPWLIVSD